MEAKGVAPQPGRISNLRYSLPSSTADGLFVRNAGRGGGWTMRAAPYTRVSTKDKVRETANQLKQLRELCKSRSWEIAAGYEPRHWQRVRPQAVSGSHAGRFPAEVRYRPVLGARSFHQRGRTPYPLQYLSSLSDCGVGFLSFTEPCLDSCGIFKDTVIAILGTIAKPAGR